MEDFQRIKKIRKRIYSRTTFLVLCIITILIVKGTLGVIKKQKESEDDLLRARLYLKSLEKREAELSSSMSYLKTSQGVEREVRDKFSVARDGEEVILVIEEEGGEGVVKSDDRSIFTKISDWISQFFKN